MIVEERKGDVFAAKDPAPFLMFAVNYEGDNCAGFAGLVARQYWPGLDGMPLAPGVLRMRSHRGTTFLAASIHSNLHVGPGWETSVVDLRRCLKVLSQYIDVRGTLIGEGTPLIDCVRLGDGPVGRAMGAPVGKLMDVLRKSPLRFRVYSL